MKRKELKELYLYNVLNLFILIVINSFIVNIVLGNIKYPKLDHLNIEPQIQNLPVWPSDLSNLKINNRLGANLLKITWDKVIGAKYYLIYYRNKLDNKWIKNKVVQDNFLILNTIIPNSNYEIIGKACSKEDNCSNLTSPEFAKTNSKDNELYCKEEIKLEESSLLAISLSWKSYVNASKYIVKIHTDDNKIKTKKIYNSGLNSKIIISDLEPNTKYNFLVFSCYENNECYKLFNTEQFILNFKPNVPDGFVVIAKDFGLIELAWIEQEYTAYHNIYMGNDLEKNVYKVQTSQNQYTFKNMDPDVEYYFWLQSCNKKDICSDLTYYTSAKGINSKYTKKQKELESKVEHKLNREISFNNIVVKRVSKKLIKLNWKPLEQINNYKIKYIFIDHDGKEQQKNFSTYNTEYLLNYDESFIEYWISMQACLNYKCSNYIEKLELKNIQDGESQQLIALNQVDNIQIKRDLLERDSYKVTWDEVKGADNYVFFYRNKKDNKWIKETIIKDNFFIIESILVNTSYEIIAKACTDEYYCSNFTEKKIIKIKPNPQYVELSCEEKLDIKKINSLSAFISWESNVNANSYLVKMFKNIPNSKIYTVYNGKDKKVYVSLLEPDIEYKFIVYGCYDDDNCYAVLHSDRFITDFASITPINFSAEVINDKGVKLSWNKQNLASYFNVYMVNLDSEDQIVKFQTTFNHFTFDNLEDNLEYNFWIQSCNRRDICSKLTLPKSIILLNSSIYETTRKNIDINELNIQTVNIPTNIIQKKISDRIIKIKWDVPNESNAKYIIKYNYINEEGEQKINYYYTNKDFYLLNHNQSIDDHTINIKNCIKEICSGYSEEISLDSIKKFNSQSQDKKYVEQIQLYNLKLKGIRERQRNQIQNNNVEFPKYIQAKSSIDKIDSYIIWEKIDQAKYYKIYLYDDDKTQKITKKLNPQDIQDIKFNYDNKNYISYYIDANLAQEHQIHAGKNYYVAVKACNVSLCSKLSKFTKLKT